MSLCMKALAYGGIGDANTIPARTTSPRQFPSYLSVTQANITLVSRLHSHRAIPRSPSAFDLGCHISSSGYPVLVDAVLPWMRPHFRAQHLPLPLIPFCQMCSYTYSLTRCSRMATLLYSLLCMYISLGFDCSNVDSPSCPVSNSVCVNPLLPSSLKAPMPISTNETNPCLLQQAKFPLPPCMACPIG
jgi:hypothetical protein